MSGPRKRPSTPAKRRILDMLEQGDQTKADLLRDIYGPPPYARSSWQHLRNLIAEYRQEGYAISYSCGAGGPGGYYRLQASPRHGNYTHRAVGTVAGMAAPAHG